MIKLTQAIGLLFKSEVMDVEIKTLLAYVYETKKLNY